MQLSLSDAARLLGKKPRQIRYLIQTGKLPAKKQSGRWLIERSDLPLSQKQENARLAKVESALAMSEAVLRGYPKGKPAFSVLDLKAFQNGRKLLQTLVHDCGPTHPACPFLRESLMRLACGCHAFQRSEKATFYAASREQGSRAVVALLLDNEPQPDLARQIESQFLSQLGGLIRRSEGKRR